MACEQNCEGGHGEEWAAKVSKLSLGSRQLKLYHMNGARSTRALWMYFELAELYGDTLPELHIHVFDGAEFRVAKPAWYLNLNPNGKVPCLVDGDVVMWESMAICVHLLRELDRDCKLAQLECPVFAAKFWQFAFFCSGTVDNLTATSLPIQRVVGNARPGDEPDAIELNHRAWLDQCGPILVSALGDAPYMAGDTFTGLDVVIGTNMHWIHEKRGWRDFPALERYFERCKARPAYLKAFQKIADLDVNQLTRLR